MSHTGSFTNTEKSKGDMMKTRTTTIAAGESKQPKKDQDSTLPPVTQEEMAALKESIETRGVEVPIVINADEVSQVKRLAFIMDECQKNGLPNFTMQSRN